MVAGVAHLDHGALAQFALQADIPALHVAQFQIGLEAVERVGGLGGKRIRRRCRERARGQRRCAQRNRARSAEVLRVVVRIH